MSTPRITIRLSKETQRRLIEGANAHHLSAAEFARRLLVNSLEGADRRLDSLDQSIERLAGLCEELVARPAQTGVSYVQFAKLAAVVERVLIQQTETLMVLRVVTYKDRPDDYELAKKKVEELLPTLLEQSRHFVTVNHGGAAYVLLLPLLASGAPDEHANRKSKDHDGKKADD